MDLRAGFQERRLALLSSCIDVKNSIGLEIGASDLPTVPATVGKCSYADFRRAEEMAEIWNLPKESVCEVDYLLTRDRGLSEQIPTKFDYVIACHVIEHVPDVISYINDLKSLLKPSAQRIIFITIPDKRATFDRTRPSVTIERLLMCYYEQVRYPLFEQLLEFHRHWVGYANGREPLPISEAYDYAKRTIESGLADAHCHVWEDREFLAQCEELIQAGFLPGLAISHFEPFFLGTNEFALVFRTNGRDIESPPRVRE